MQSHAVVIGGGIGGLLAAHALTDRFQRVTVLERHSYTADLDGEAPAARRGVPQSRCLHLLMAAGVAAFDELMPGWTNALVARGAVPFDASADSVMRFPAGWLPRSHSGITCYACSRALLEEVLRSGFAHNEAVQVCEGQRVLGLLSDAKGERVTGVRIASSPGSPGAELHADLVVDASGRSSVLPEWLAALPNGKWAPVEETVVESGTQYVSRWFRLDHDHAPDWHCLSVAPGEGTSPRSAMMLRAENNCWGVVLLAPADDSMPSDDREFLDFADGLGEGKLRAALVSARPLSPIHRYGATANRLRHYERYSDWPAGLVALGDAVCALDPYCGLGMTAAARGAVLLRTRLAEGGREVASPSEGQFQHALAALNEQPWQLATGGACDGGRTTELTAQVMGLYDVAPSSPEVAHALLAVHHLLRTRASLMELNGA